jgi:hypothetical protein
MVRFEQRLTLVTVIMDDAVRQRNPRLEVIAARPSHLEVFGTP